jgi:hypothetical protein
MALFRLSARRGARRSDAGQVLVIFAVSITVLFGAAGLAFDIGRFYSERRFLQNAADAAALAAGSALIRGETVAQADAEARDILTRNFMSSPSGITPALPPVTPVYAAGHSGEPEYLTNGILICPTPLASCPADGRSEVRVAVQNTLGYTFGRVVGLDQNTIGGQARVATNGTALPIAVRHYINAPGPTSGAVSPCDGDIHDFQDLLSTADTSCLGTDTNSSLRTKPTPGMDYSSSTPNNDPSHHGPIIQLIGQGANSTNTSSFRGFVALDIRDFRSASSNVFYNGVTIGTTASTLADVEAGWVAKGYPGPDFPIVTTPPNPDDQVGILDGNKSGIIITAIGNRFRAGDEVLASVYSGVVMTIPDFTMSPAPFQKIGSNQNLDNAVTMSVTKNNAFTGTVATTAFTDRGDSLNPYGGSLSALTFTPTPATPAATIRWATFNTTGAPAGIYTIWIQGHSPSPYLTDHFYPVAIMIGGPQRDFANNGSGVSLSTATTGTTVTGSITFTTSNDSVTAFANAAPQGVVNLTLEGAPNADPLLDRVLPVGLGATSLTPSTFNLTKTLTSQVVSVSINGGSLGPGEYPLTIRATGTNGDGQPVTHLIPITLDIATGSTTSEYVDISGFAIFRITNINSNSVDGYAISSVYANPNDPALRLGQVARLVPWN